ncbi:hypothetical protein AB685_05385 [Bacillus sp. LL01]|uniref:sunset domain-containing protein n=1 Tax=Bacillus sp. LL01 TaxID=1665556 RepID=UPI00064D70A2|nr:hypothetical protein [Bacillus sp. LL01]KMJ60259.1 hypothetical protein AB685_05385 [Bacillus sp. LL01]
MPYNKGNSNWIFIFIEGGEFAMKNLLKALSFFLVIGSGLVTIFRLNKTNKQLMARETTSFQVKQTLEAIAATLEKTMENERLSQVEAINAGPFVQNSKALETPNEKVENLDLEHQENPPLIKANKNARGEYIYHVPGGVFYNRTTPVEWFHTEEEAQAKGYRKSAR